MNIRQTKTFLCNEDFPIARTRAGKLRGYLSDDVYCFRGVEYAQARRFHMPEPVTPWEGVKNAVDYGHGCPEMSYSLEGKSAQGQMICPQRLWYMGEDVQNLNLWTKSLDPAAKRPVMVWMHGGGFAGGSATQLFAYDGWEMAHNYDVVLVTVNHRLNMLGYFDLSDYGEQYAHSGNLGQADLVAALEWVRDNIASFGGDPDNVTIYGQSGGGGKVMTLMQMPAADGLYHKAIIQSGIGAHRRGGEVRRDREMVARTVELLGLTRDTIGQIETMDYTIVANAVRQAVGELGIGSPMSWSVYNWSPVPDGTYYPGNPFEVGFRRECNHIPLLAGTCLSEFGTGDTIGTKANWTDGQRLAALEKVYGAAAPAVRDAFQAAYPELDWAYAACTDNNMRPATVDFLTLRAQQLEAPVYNYLFTFESPLFGGQMPGHSGDLHFTFHNAAYCEAMTKPGVTERVQDEMAGAWAAFAATGSPNGRDLPVWKPFRADAPYTLCFGDTTVLKKGHDAELQALLSRSAPAQMPR